MADDKKPSNYDEVMDAKMQAKNNAAYDAADSTPANPKSTAGSGQGMRGMKKMADGGLAKKSDAIPDEANVPKKFAAYQKEKSRRLPEASPKNAVYGMDASQDQSYAKGGKVSASSRADGIAQRGKTRGMMC
jgi:hypothetical protein